MNQFFTPAPIAFDGSEKLLYFSDGGFPCMNVKNPVVFFDYQLDVAKILGMALVLGPTAWLMIQQKMQKMPPDQEPLDGE